ncbi:MAG: tRNA (guanosine(37)-N1)-methyltransferase TrmD [Lachnospiraceae bacterium]|nr:tRNA (guanosine(37)-N1)-methyltransferase TrmD [Lachnospiraceae bacterium]
MNFYVMTLFPEMVLQGVNTSITGRGIKAGAISVEAFHIRDYTLDKHGKTEDAPYGGGVGLVMQAQPIWDCYQAVLKRIEENHCASEQTPGDQSDAPEDNDGSSQEQMAVCGRAPGKPRVLYMSPQGRVFDQQFAEELAKEEDLVMLCGHYEGVDERVLELMDAEEVSIGDYVLTGGELPAMVMIDCISRLVPGVLGKIESAEVETFTDHLIEYPQYSRPEVFMDKRVPEVLLSGHHANVDKWRREQSIERTLRKRPDLLETAVLTLSKKELKFLDELKLRVAMEEQEEDADEEEELIPGAPDGI